MTDKTSLFKKCIADVFQRDDLALAISTGTPSPGAHLVQSAGHSISM
jgi:hypothetical protein